MTNTFIKKFPWDPTGQQIEAFKHISDYLKLNEADRSCFILKGYAGTGKTTIVSTIVRSLPAFKIRTVLLAPTGRAAKVMTQYSGKRSSTIHKKIYRKKQAISLDQVFDLAENKHEHTLFIVDEASMITNERYAFNRKSLLEDLINYVKKGKKCLLLFVGDTAQLPPVGYLESPALDAELLARNFGFQTQFYELTEVVRQAENSGILVNATNIRTQIQEGRQDSSTEKLTPKLQIGGFKDIFKMRGDRLIEGLHYAYDKFGIENTLVICRSNKSANLYNRHIRHTILFREDELSGGDHVMVVRNNYYWLTKEDEKNTSFIANGDMALVQRVRNVHEQYGFRFADVTLRFLDDADEQTLECRVMLDTLHSDSPNLGQADQEKLYKALLADHSQAKTKRAQMELLKNDPYYNALQIKFSMAITCHKAQGGQWKAVFIDQGYLSEERIDLEFLRWLYTACTRATDELFLVNFNQTFFL